jgi:hypothetical protein
MVAILNLRFPFPSPHHCGLDGDLRAGGDRRGIAGDRSEAEDGARAIFLFREE